MQAYLYLIPVGIVAVALFAYAVKHVESLTVASLSPTRKENALLAGLLLVGIAAVYGRFFLGTAYFAYLDSGLDTIDQYVPFYLNLLDSIRDGSFGAWNFDFGLGSSALGYQSWLLDPFNILLVPLGLLLGDSQLSLVLVIVQASKVLIAGFAFDRLATYFCKTPLARIVGSMLYAFCGFLMLWGQHYWLGGLCVAFVILLLVLERLVERLSAGRFASVALVVAICAAWSAYSAFMVLVAAAVYMLLRLIHLAPDSHAGRFIARRTGRLCAAVACGLLLSCIALVPYALYLLSETGRVSSSGESGSLLANAMVYLSEWVPLQWLPGIASRLLGSSLITAGGSFPEELLPATESFPYVNCYEFVMIGLGSAVLILLGQFAVEMAKHGTRRDKVVVCIAAALMVLYCVNDFLPALMNALVEPKYRSVFVLAVPLCLACAVAWETRIQTRSVSRGALAVCAITTLAIVAWSFVNSVDGRRICAFFALCALALTVLLFVKWPKRAIPVLLAACAALVVLPVMADGFFVTNHRTATTSETFPDAQLEDQGESADADTMAALAFLEELDPSSASLYRIEKTYTDWCYFNDALIEGYHGVNAYNSTTDGDVVAFYKAFWPDAIKAGGTYQSVNYDADGLSAASRLGVRYLLSKEPLSDARLELLQVCGSVYVYRNTADVGVLSGSNAVVSESEVLALPNVEERRAVLGQAVVVPDEVAARITVDDAKQDGATAEVTTVAAEFSLEGSSHIEGVAQASVDSVACLSIPHTAGWSVYVDGQEVETFCANYGFIGFELSAGEHTVEAYYQPNGLAAGAAGSAVGFVVAVAVCIALAVNRRKRAAI